MMMETTEGGPPEVGSEYGDGKGLLTQSQRKRVVEEELEVLSRETGEELASLSTPIKLVRALTLVQLGLARSTETENHGDHLPEELPDLFPSDADWRRYDSSPHDSYHRPPPPPPPPLPPLPQAGPSNSRPPSTRFQSPLPGRAAAGMGLMGTHELEMGNELKGGDYATLVELLASALGDLTGGGRGGARRGESDMRSGEMEAQQIIPPQSPAPSPSGTRLERSGDATTGVRVGWMDKARGLRRRHSADSQSPPRSEDTTPTASQMQFATNPVGPGETIDPLAAGGGAAPVAPASGAEEPGAVNGNGSVSGSVNVNGEEEVGHSQDLIALLTSNLHIMSRLLRSNASSSSSSSTIDRASAFQPHSAQVGGDGQSPLNVEPLWEPARPSHRRDIVDSYTPGGMWSSDPHHPSQHMGYPRRCSSPEITRANVTEGDLETLTAENVKKSALLRLPSELQRRIFKQARVLSQDPAAWIVVRSDGPEDGKDGKNRHGRRSGKGTVDHRDGVSILPSTGPIGAGIVHPSPFVGIYDFDADGNPIPHPITPRPKGGRRKAQEYAHGLTMVCKSLVSVARSGAFENVHIRTRRQVQALVKLWKGEYDDYDDLDAEGERGGGFRTEAARRRRLVERGWVVDDSPMSSVVSFETILGGYDVGLMPPPQEMWGGGGGGGSGGGGVGGQGKGCGEKKVEKEEGMSEDEVVERREKVEERKAMRRSELMDAGKAVRRANIEVPAATGDVDRDRDPARRAPRRIRGRRAMYGYSGLRTAPDLSSSLAELHSSRRAAADAESQQLPQLFGLMPNVQELSLCITPGRGTGHYGGGLGGQGYGLEGMEGEILTALCGLKALRSFTLRQSIDFSELEVLIPCLPELKHLRLEGGLDNVDGRGDVDPDAEHCCKLQTFTLQNLDFESGDISSTQLCWILKNSVGTLKTLDLMVYAGGAHGQNAWIPGGGGGGTHSPFACRAFADLLVGLAPTLRHLALRDCSTFGQVAPDLRQAPHNGFLDYALLHCTNLEHVALEWFVTGSEVLDCLTVNQDQMIARLATVTPAGTASTSAHVLRASSALTAEPRPLRTMIFFGSPERTSAKAILDAIHRPYAFPNLESITLASFPSQRNGNPVPWPSRDLRKLRQACASKNISFQFAI